MSYQNYGQNQGQGGRYGQINPYAQQDDQYEPQGGYAQQAGYGGQQQPGYGQQDGYDERQAAYGQQQPAAYGQQQGAYGQQTGVAARPEPQTYPSSNYGNEQGNNAYEMGAMNGQSNQKDDPNAFFNAITAVKKGIEEVDGPISNLRRLYMERGEMVAEKELKAQDAKIDKLEEDIGSFYRNLTQRMARIKSDPASGSPRNAPQVGFADRELRRSIHEYQRTGAELRERMMDQNERILRITNPNASEAEAKAAREDPLSSNLFQQALFQSDRRGNAQSTVSQVRDRSQRIKKIERDMIALNELVQDMDNSVIQQEAAVTNIEQQGEQVEENVAKANVEIDGAIVSAKAARRKKFWCLGIIILILIIIAVVVAVVVVVLRRKNSSPAPAAAPAPTTGTAAKIRMLRDRGLEPVRS